jgi:hypothetical protein
MTPPVVLKVGTVAISKSKVDARNGGRGEIIPFEWFQAWFDLVRCKLSLCHPDIAP